MVDLPPSLARDISPPRPAKRRKTSDSLVPKEDMIPKPAPNNLHESTSPDKCPQPTLAEVEAGKARIDNHLSYFRAHFSKLSRPTDPFIPRLPLCNFSDLYTSNCNPRGHHFVVHQHNHPRAGVHYDLRLQFSETSSLSFAIPKGLPGDPNSRSIGRLAVETRVHNFWNHLIESASHETGSLLIWDTGTYSILSRRATTSRGDAASPQTSEDEHSSTDEEKDDRKTTGSPYPPDKQENDKLISAFQSKYIRLRLHGTHLPPSYTIILRLPSTSTTSAPHHRKPHTTDPQTTANTLFPHHSQPAPLKQDPEALSTAPNNTLDTSTDSDTQQTTQTRTTNAYPGATNSIGSVHQRHWFLQLDRRSSGFVLEKGACGEGKGRWVRSGDGGGFEAFFVGGREVERSVVTGRLARDVEGDEGVGGFVGRRGWRGVVG
ncbi:hypothetical protein IAQ61_009706 [Plenodomus lingam]|uniref:uncharacterized protein n=1 Tax=Leptosphaeria maculans TaxID=5022 RepID=UPI00332FB23D|nr:hypothetical protein IAQ61_009706 [Plenodomus lingam]